MKKNIINNNININADATRVSKQIAVCRAMKQDGKWLGMPSQGYLITRNKCGEAILVPDPERFDFIKSMLKALVNGTCSIYEVKQAFDAVYTTPKYEHVGGHKVHSIRSLKRLLSKPVYAGLVTDLDDPTVFHRGQHEAMITMDEWWKLRRILKGGGEKHDKH